MVLLLLHAALALLLGARVGAGAQAAGGPRQLRAMSMFKDGMVLQSSATGPRHARIWGEAPANAVVSLCMGTLDACTPRGTAVAGSNGSWAITLAVEPSGPHTLGLSASTGGGARLTAADVYFGNVLVCSGQSNLEFTMDQVDDSAAEEAAADAPRLRGMIRLFSAPDNKTFPGNSSSAAGAFPQKYLPEDCAGTPGNCGGGAPTGACAACARRVPRVRALGAACCTRRAPAALKRALAVSAPSLPPPPPSPPRVTVLPAAATWYEANSTTIKRFSALCYLVAREMVRRGGGAGASSATRWGLVQSAKGGTPVEGWIAGDQLARFTKCGMDPTCPVFSQGAPPADASRFFTEWSRPSVLYNQMMAPIAGFQAVAVLWDQGEANMDEGFMLRREQYACLFRQMIQSWRQAWGDASLPFVFPQLHACGSQKNNCSNADCAAGSWTTIRSAQDDVAQAGVDHASKTDQRRNGHSQVSCDFVSFAARHAHPAGGQRVRAANRTEPNRTDLAGDSHSRELDGAALRRPSTGWAWP